MQYVHIASSSCLFRAINVAKGKERPRASGIPQLHSDLRASFGETAGDEF